MSDFNLTRVCTVCDGDGIRQVWEGAIDPVTGEYLPPGDAACPFCDAGKHLIGTIEIDEFDTIITAISDLADAVSDVADKCDDIKDIVDHYGSG